MKQFAPASLAMFTLALFTLFAPVTASAGTGCSEIGLGQGASLNGFIPFPQTDPWRQTVTTASVSANSAAIIGGLGRSGLHPDFGAGDGRVSYGIPYNVVSGVNPEPIHYKAYGDQSDPGPMPIPASTHVEGYPTPGGDRHVLVIDRDNCFLYELYDAYVQGDGSWNADSGAIWDLLNNNSRPYTWTSADAAGLPIFPGLARYDEVSAGKIDHALRFTLQRTTYAMIAPATHSAGNSSGPYIAPMGTRMRLKANYDISGFPPQAKVVLQALKTYGMILADNGANLFVSGTSDSRWDDNDLQTLSRVPASAFDVVNTGSSISPKAITSGLAPVITSLTASSTTVDAGQAVRIVWTANNASYYIVTPLGPMRGSFAILKPTKTTTYTVYATNHYGRTSKNITINVR